MEGRTNVFALGDTTKLPISKAGSTAHFEAEALGENIAVTVRLGSPVRDIANAHLCKRPLSGQVAKDRFWQRADVLRHCQAMLRCRRTTIPKTNRFLPYRCLAVRH